MLHRHKIRILGNADIHIHFLAQLAFQRSMTLFADLYLTAGELKFIAYLIKFAFITLHAQNLAVMLNYRCHYLIMLHHYNLRFFFLFPILPHIFSLGNLLPLRQHIKALAVRCHRQRTVVMRRQHLRAKMR